VDLYRVGEVHFVRDGHHRVAVARALGREVIAARVVLVHTAVGAGVGLTLADLPLKGQERLFAERVPLPPALRSRVVLRDADDYAMLAEGVEAWGFRRDQERGELGDRPTTALAWFTEEYEPVLNALRDAGRAAGSSTGSRSRRRTGWPGRCRGCAGCRPAAVSSRTRAASSTPRSTSSSATLASRSGKAMFSRTDRCG